MNRGFTPLNALPDKFYRKTSKLRVSINRFRKDSRRHLDVYNSGMY